MEFEKWFTDNLEVRDYPKINNMLFQVDRYDYVINVSDEYYSLIDNEITDHAVKSFWFPMNEVVYDAGLNSIYGAMIILYQAYHSGSKVYLHCHAGANRSHVVSAAFYYMMTGNQLEEYTNGFINMMLRMCAREYLPNRYKTERFLTELGKQLDKFKGEPMGGTLEQCKMEM